MNENTQTYLYSLQRKESEERRKCQRYLGSNFSPLLQACQCHLPTPQFLRSYIKTMALSPKGCSEKTRIVQAARSVLSPSLSSSLSPGPTSHAILAPVFRQPPALSSHSGAVGGVLALLNIRTWEIIPSCSVCSPPGPGASCGINTQVTGQQGGSLLPHSTGCFVSHPTWDMDMS